MDRVPGGDVWPQVGAASPGGHALVQKTVLKSEKCGVCHKRLKFGKLVLRCTACRLALHTDCSPAAAACAGTSPAGGGHSPEPAASPRRRPGARKQIFASPMLR